jgi:hypothetical protein
LSILYLVWTRLSPKKDAFQHVEGFSSKIPLASQQRKHFFTMLAMKERSELSKSLVSIVAPQKLPLFHPSRIVCVSITCKLKLKSRIGVEKGSLMLQRE